jgi:hypothetical protein
MDPNGKYSPWFFSCLFFFEMGSVALIVDVALKLFNLGLDRKSRLVGAVCSVRRYALRETEKSYTSAYKIMM